MKLIAEDALLSIAKDVTLANGAKHRCIDATQIVELPKTEIVHCKDCKHRPIKPEDYENGFDLEFPDGVCPCQCDDGWYSWYPADNWFCADGEPQEVEADGNH